MSENKLQLRRTGPDSYGEGIVLCGDDGRMLPGQREVKLVTACEADPLITVTFVVDGDGVSLALTEEALNAPPPTVGR